MQNPSSAFAVERLSLRLHSHGSAGHRSCKYAVGIKDLAGLFSKLYIGEKAGRTLSKNGAASPAGRRLRAKILTARCSEPLILSICIFHKLSRVMCCVLVKNL